MSILSIANLDKSFGHFPVIKKLNLHVEAGSRHAIIGPNGAGKTTLFNLITGWVRPDAGTIEVAGRDVARLAPHHVTRAGIARSFQRNMLLESLTAYENLRIAAQARHRSRWSLLRSPRRYIDVHEVAADIADRMGLSLVLDTPVNALSYGQKRQLEVGIALCAKPSVLLMDEPAAGMSPSERERLLGLVAGLPRELTILLVEHDMDVVFGMCDTITVLNYGCVLAQGTESEIRRNPAVQSAYLGTEHA
jgi:branched-chain amino acid transport system ATP-binding protein